VITAASGTSERRHEPEPGAMLGEELFISGRASANVVYTRSPFINIIRIMMLAFTIRSNILSSIRLVSSSCVSSSNSRWVEGILGVRGGHVIMKL